MDPVTHQYFTFLYAVLDPGPGDDISLLALDVAR